MHSLGASCGIMIPGKRVCIIVGMMIKSVHSLHEHLRVRVWRVVVWHIDRSRHVSHGTCVEALHARNPTMIAVLCVALILPFDSGFCALLVSLCGSGESRSHVPFSSVIGTSGCA